MSRFLIEVPHDETMLTCARAIKLFLETGSHFLTHADWGCKGGVHKAWMTVETESRESAWQIVPPLLRSAANVVPLTEYTMQEVDEILHDHHPSK